MNKSDRYRELNPISWGYFTRPQDSSKFLTPKGGRCVILRTVEASADSMLPLVPGHHMSFGSIVLLTCNVPWISFFSGNVAHSTIVSLGDLQNKSRNVRNTPWCRRDTGCEGVSLVSSGDRHVLETQRSYRFIPCEPIDWWVWGIWTHIWNYQILSVGLP